MNVLGALIGSFFVELVRAIAVKCVDTWGAAKKHAKRAARAVHE